VRELEARRAIKIEQHPSWPSIAPCSA